MPHFCQRQYHQYSLPPAVALAALPLRVSIDILTPLLVSKYFAAAVTEAPK